MRHSNLPKHDPHLNSLLAPGAAPPAAAQAVARALPHRHDASSHGQVATGRRHRCDPTEPLRVDPRLAAELSGMAGRVAAKVSRTSGGGSRRRWGVGSRRTWRPWHRSCAPPGAGCSPPVAPATGSRTSGLRRLRGLRWASGRLAAGGLGQAGGQSDEPSTAQWRSAK